MNRIHMELVQTIYDYGEYYWMIDGRPIVRYLNEAVSAGACPRLEVFGSLEGLLPAWTGELVWKAENRFIWEMVDSVEDFVEAARVAPTATKATPTINAAAVLALWRLFAVKVRIARRA